MYQFPNKRLYIDIIKFINDYDDSEAATVDAGALNYEDLTIKWRIHFT